MISLSEELVELALQIFENARKPIHSRFGMLGGLLLDAPKRFVHYGFKLFVLVHLYYYIRLIYQLQYL
ncbi:MAG: hypothetical protein ACQETQ_08355 [Spirochaetota bacterium]